MEIILANNLPQKPSPYEVLTPLETLCGLDYFDNLLGPSRI